MRDNFTITRSPVTGNDTTPVWSDVCVKRRPINEELTQKFLNKLTLWVTKVTLLIFPIMAENEEFATNKLPNLSKM